VVVVLNKISGIISQLWYPLMKTNIFLINVRSNGKILSGIAR